MLLPRAMSDVLKVGIIGAGGYTGAELLRLVHAHPKLELTYVAAREKAGKRLAEVIPSTFGVEGVGDRVLESFDPEKAHELKGRIDVAFLALPHATSARVGRALFEAGIRVVDLSADFRLKDVNVYTSTYGEHPAPELLAQAVYGQPELHRAELLNARLIAAPGCYVTTAILPLVPLLKENLIEHDPIIIDAKSGISGGGRSPSPAFHYPEAAEGMRPYKIAGTHRHIPEIEQELTRAAGSPIRVVFTPQLAPMTRGILAICYARPKPGVTDEQCREAARKTYATGLVSVLDQGVLPDTLWVRGSARAHVAYAFDARTRMLLAMGTTDNLARGASAQAVQALNVSMGWKDSLGLPELGIFP